MAAARVESACRLAAPFSPRRRCCAILERVFASSGGRPLDRVSLRDAAHDAPAGARHGLRMVQAETPVPVRVWLTNSRGEHRFDGVAVAWTSTQVRVRYLDDTGREGWTWQWAPAVERR